METTPNPFDHAVCLSVTLRRFGTQRQVPAAAIETDADRRLLRLSKTILDCQDLQAIGQLDTAIRRYVQSRCLVNVRFRPGIYLLPMTLIADVDARLHLFADQRAQLVDRLTPGPDGKPKTFRASLLEHARDFFAVFNERNLTGRLDLNELAEEAQQVLANVDAPALRQSDTLRSYVGKGFREIQTQLDGAIIPRPIRQIRFDGEENLG